MWSLIECPGLPRIPWRIVARLHVSSSRFFILLCLKIFPELTVPRRNHDRDGTLRLCLAGKPNQRFGFRGVDVAKFFDLLSFACGNVRKLLGATEHANPTGSARS